MSVYISLLRGINVSGQKKIGMKELKTLYEQAGFEDVQTYIQSGNVVFRTEKKNTEQIGRQIEDAIQNHYGFKVTMVVSSPEDLDKIIRSNPFQKEPDFETGKMYVCFLTAEPEKELLEKIRGVRYESDRFIIIGKTIYLFVPSGYGNTKLNNNFFESKLKTSATTRNWNTVNKLLEIARNT